MDMHLSFAGKEINKLKGLEEIKNGRDIFVIQWFEHLHSNLLIKNHSELCPCYTVTLCNINTRYNPIWYWL